MSENYQIDHYALSPEQRTVTIADIDATTGENRIALLQTCIDEENHSKLGAGSGYYWGVSEPITDNPTHTIGENLVWETMHPDSPRPVFHHRIFYIAVRKFYGYIDVQTQCRSIARHDATKDTHPCINRDPLCFDIDLEVISYDIHPMSDYPYPKDIDIFRHELTQHFTMVYSHSRHSGRIITCNYPYIYVPPYLAATDGLIDRTVLTKLAQSDKIIPDISIIPSEKVITV